MPHIKPVRRALFDEIVDQLPPIYDKGDLTYLICRLQMRFANDTETLADYQRHSDAVAAAADAAHEYRRRILDHYEDGAAARNGDIFTLYMGVE